MDIYDLNKQIPDSIVNGRYSQDKFDGVLQDYLDQSIPISEIENEINIVEEKFQFYLEEVAELIEYLHDNIEFSENQLKRIGQFNIGTEKLENLVKDNIYKINTVLGIEEYNSFVSKVKKVLKKSQTKSYTVKYH